MVAETKPRQKAAPAIVGTIAGGEDDPNPILELDPDTVDTEVVQGTEVMPPRSDAQRNMIRCGEKWYPLPRFGPLVIVMVQDMQQTLVDAQARMNDLVAAGVPQEQAAEQAGYGEALTVFLRFVKNSLKQVIPEDVLMMVPGDQLMALSEQIRPFDAAAERNSNSAASPS